MKAGDKLLKQIKRGTIILTETEEWFLDETDTELFSRN